MRSTGPGWGSTSACVWASLRSMADQVNNTPIALSPSTYERHSAAVEFVEQQIRTRDPRWGTGRFPGIVSGHWALLEQPNSIAGGSGMSIGTGQVKHCDRAGLPIDDNEVTVYNVGPEIDASDGDRIVRLTWTAGDWCVSCMGPPGPYE